MAAGFQNPRFVQAIDEMKRNPAEAQRKYANDPEVRLFMSEFSKIMAGHFHDVAKTKEEQALEDPEV
jgi:hypothetical protein